MGGSGQGTLLSVLLFVIKMNQLINNLDQRICLKEGPDVVHEVHTQQLAYIDDVIFICPFKNTDMLDQYGDKIYQDDGSVRAYLQVVEEFSRNSGLQLNQAKCFATTFDWDFNARTSLQTA